MNPAGILLPPYSAYYWEPASDVAYAYDPAKGRGNARGRRLQDVDGDGFRETKDGKPLKLRLYTDSGTPENVSTSKLAVGWFRERSA